jgi:broad-specificity NMP kinase
LKHIYLIGGAMGIGKTTVCQILKRKLPNAVFLDGDWCWDASPFQVTEETKAMVMDNICYLLNQFIHCSAYDNILFCWVMHEQSIIDAILARLDTEGCLVKNISLICSAEKLTKQLQKDIQSGVRMQSSIERSLARLPLYAGLKTIKIDTEKLTAEEVADQIKNG